MLKSTKLRKQRKARGNLKEATDTKTLHLFRQELYNKLEENLVNTNPKEPDCPYSVIAFEVREDKVGLLMELLDKDFLVMYDVQQVSQTLFAFKVKTF